MDLSLKSCFTQSISCVFNSINDCMLVISSSAMLKLIRRIDMNVYIVIVREEWIFIYLFNHPLAS